MYTESRKGVQRRLPGSGLENPVFLTVWVVVHVSSFSPASSNTRFWQLLADVRVALEQCPGDDVRLQVLMKEALEGQQGGRTLRSAAGNSESEAKPATDHERAIAAGYSVCIQLITSLQWLADNGESLHSSDEATGRALISIAVMLRAGSCLRYREDAQDSDLYVDSLECSRVFAVESATHDLKLRACRHFLRIVELHRPISSEALEIYLGETGVPDCHVSLAERRQLLRLYSALPRGKFDDQWGQDLKAVFSQILFDPNRRLAERTPGWWIWFTKEAQEVGELELRRCDDTAVDTVDEPGQQREVANTGESVEVEVVAAQAQNDALENLDAREVYDRVYFDTMHVDLADAPLAVPPVSAEHDQDAIPAQVREWKALRLIRTPFPQLYRIFEGKERLLAKALRTSADTINKLLRDRGGQKSETPVAAPAELPKEVGHDSSVASGTVSPFTHSETARSAVAADAERGDGSTVPSVHPEALAPIQGDDAVEQRRLVREREVVSNRSDRSADLKKLSGGSHSKIRETWVRHYSRYGADVACWEALAWATHPWPDFELSPELTDEIAAELLPAMNIGVTDPILNSADRLWRIAEVFDHHSLNELKAAFEEKAALLESEASRLRSEPHGEVFPAQLGAILISPTGRGVVASYECLSGDEENSGVHELAMSVRKGLLTYLASQGVQDISELWGSFVGLSVADLGFALGIEPLGAVMASFLRSLDQRSREILDNRTLTDSPMTGAAIAERWGLTRSRVGQLEGRANEKLHARLGQIFDETNSHIERVIGARVLRLSMLKSVGKAVCGTGDGAIEALQYLLCGRGQWVLRGQWAIAADVAVSLDGEIAAIEGSETESHLLPREEAQSRLGFLFQNEEELEEYLSDLGWAIVGDRWLLKDSIQARVHAAVICLGRPVTKEEIAEQAAVTIDQVRAAIGNMGVLVRADRTRWGLAEWIDDPYDGIVGEIQQRIDAGDGVAVVETVVREITEKFGVAENSVRAYLSSGAFEIEAGLVRSASEPKFVPGDIQESSDVVRVGDLWGQRMILHARFFEGYSLGIPFDTAYHNGIRPSDSLLVPINQTEYEASVIWRLGSLNRRIDVGRAREFLTAHSFSPEDEVIVVVTRSGVEFLRADEFDRQATRVIEMPSGDETGETAHTIQDPLLDLLGGGE